MPNCTLHARPPGWRSAISAAVLLALAAGAALAAPEGLPAAGRDADGYAPLRPVGECIDPARVRSWALDGDERLLIDAGRRHYLVELSTGCPELGINPFIGFVSRNPSGRICGDIGDRVVPHGSAAAGRGWCPIQRVNVIDEAQYAALVAGDDVATR